MGAAGVGPGAAVGLQLVEVCVPLLLLCWLCCWPDDARSDSTSGRHPQRPVLVNAHESGSRRRASEALGRRVGSSAVSLHLPSTSGYKKPLSAHRSHEEIGRRKSNLDGTSQEARYHSAPSVIDEVLHRRDWERSKQDLYIPLKPDPQNPDPCSSNSSSTATPEAPHAEPESSSIEETRPQETKPCKKHHTNIKSSRGKEKRSSDIKDADATESSDSSTFYIGESNEDTTVIKNTEATVEVSDVHTKSIYKAKDAKQSFNESIKTKERPRQTLVTLEENQPRLGFCMGDVIDQLESLDRSGAVHHSIESRVSLSGRPMFPPSSVEPVGYEGGACYLGEVGWVSELRGAPPAGWRPRHASDGDILAPHHRPESGAFSESDLDLELEGAEELPPPYDDVEQYTAPDRKETAI